MTLNIVAFRLPSGQPSPSNSIRRDLLAAAAASPALALPALAAPVAKRDNRATTMATQQVALAALLLSACASPALAVQGAPIAFVRADQANPVASTTVGLNLGQDYLLEADGFGTVQLYNPQGQVTVTLGPRAAYPSVVQPFRAAYTATYGIRATFDSTAPEGFSNGNVTSWLYQDCRDDTKTKCRLAPANSSHGLIVATGDRDWYGVALLKGVRYRFSLASSGGQAYLALRSPTGTLLVRHTAPAGGTATIDYQASSSSTYFATVSLVLQTNIEYDLSFQRR